MGRQEEEMWEAGKRYKKAGEEGVTERRRGKKDPTEASPLLSMC